MAMFRLSVTLTEPVDPEVLRRAQARTLPRFPSFTVRIRRGVFWYYLEQLDGMPDITEDGPFPCALLVPRRNRGFSFRVKYYQNRIAVEFYHILSDGTGGMCFLKTLAAEYLRLKYGVGISCVNGVLDPDQPPDRVELEDSFLKNAGPVARAAREPDSCRIRGTPDADGYVSLICGVIPVAALRAKAMEHQATVTEFLAGVLIASADALQQRENPVIKRPVMLCIPVNLRRFFDSRTLRNFSSFVNVGIDPDLGEYSLDEIIGQVHHTMGLALSRKQLGARFTANVRSERNALLRVMPLPVKNAAMKIAFRRMGDRKNFTTLSNLGLAAFPPEMERYVERCEFVLGPLSYNPVACAAVSYGGNLYLNITRSTEEPYLEREFFTSLVKMGIPVKIESNGRKVL